MAIIKPSWLRTILDYLNWDILGYQVYVGDAVESAIDWAIDRLNTALEWADAAWDYAANAWWKAVQVGVDAWNDLQAVAWELRTSISDIWAELVTWWDDRVDDFWDLVDGATGWLEDRLDDAEWVLDELRDNWDTFWRDIWPGWMQYLEELAGRVGDFFSLTLPDLITSADIIQAFNDFRREWADLFTFWSEFRTELGQFISDPVEWLFNKAVDWFLGPEK